MTTKHTFTLGTWFPVGAWVEHLDDSVADICTCNPADFGQGHLNRSNNEIFANAKLIAAAPQLLEALIEFVTLADKHEDLESAYNNAKSAIDKATS